MPSISSCVDSFRHEECHDDQGPVTLCKGQGHEAQGRSVLTDGVEQLPGKGHRQEFAPDGPVSQRTDNKREKPVEEVRETGQDTILNRNIKSQFFSKFCCTKFLAVLSGKCWMLFRYVGVSMRRV